MGRMNQKRPSVPLQAGQKFGRLTVTGEIQVDRREYPSRMYTLKYYEMRCDCGNTAWVPKQSLVSGATTSCGCFRKEASKARQDAKKNAASAVPTPVQTHSSQA